MTYTAEDKAQDFKVEILSLCRTYNLFISHQDGHGAFLIENGEKLSSDQKNIYRKWFMAADLVN